MKKWNCERKLQGFTCSKRNQVEKSDEKRTLPSNKMILKEFLSADTSIASLLMGSKYNETKTISALSSKPSSFAIDDILKKSCKEIEDDKKTFYDCCEGNEINQTTSLNKNSTSSFESKMASSNSNNCHCSQRFALPELKLSDNKSDLEFGVNSILANGPNHVIGKTRLYI